MDVEEQYSILLARLAEESEFFDMIGLDKQVTLNGLSVLDDDACIGWTHTIQTVNRYNIGSIEYLSDDEYPSKKVLADNKICLI